MKNSFQIGASPFDRQLMTDALDEFASIYDERPIKDNEGGMQAPHLFATWFMAKTLAPEFVIESGVWKGQGTWILEQACPDASIHSLDLNLLKREYVSGKVTYHEKDLAEIDWTVVDPSKTLVFLDDHQNACSRLQLCKWYGFRDLIFEDNYQPGEGDFYSLKMILAGSGWGRAGVPGSGQQYRSLSAKIGRKVRSLLRQLGATNSAAIPQFSRSSVPPNDFDAKFMRNNVEVYAEFPPVFAKEGFSAPEPLLDGSSRSRHRIFADQADSYTGICYVRLKGD